MIYNAVRLTIGKLPPFVGLRTEFEINSTPGYFDKAELKVYNMKQESFDALEYDALSVVEVLSETGWEQIYTGNFRLKQRENRDGSSISTLNLFSSIRTYTKKYSLSMEENSTGNDVLKFFKDAMPSTDFIINEKAQGIIDGLVFKGGYSPQVSTYYQLLNDFIVNEVGAEFKPRYTNSNVIIGLSSKEPVRIDSRNGMVGVPEFAKVIYRDSEGNDNSAFQGRVTARLLPTLNVHDKIYVESNYIKLMNSQQFTSGATLTEQQYQSVTQPGSGLYQVWNMKHQGDTHAETWQTKIEFREVIQ
ncbi:hypothetical protein [Vibrio harveyi]|uniref:hypothetical protein n=1 Tax=Vibrio harveyi TaxID=669 RepID=UPI003CF4F1EB